MAEPPYLWAPLERFFPETMRFDDLHPVFGEVFSLLLRSKRTALPL
ncbi:MAG: hypothetical protein WAM82_11895 [Thermoanaerobaculia bacterium]